MKQLPKISVVTPSFNQGRFLKDTIESVLKQGYPNVELIIIDGGSSDCSVSVIQQYGPNLAWWCSEPDDGQSDAINKGFAKATGDIFCFLNSDDLYCPNTLNSVAEAYLKCRNPSKFFHAFAVEDFDANGTLGVVRPHQWNLLIDWLEYRANLHQPGVFWSRELHHAVGGFDATYRYAFDRKFFMEAIRLGYRIETSPDVTTTRFRHHGESKTVTVGEQDQGFADEFIRATKEVSAKLSSYQRNVPLLLQKAESLRCRFRDGTLASLYDEELKPRLSKLPRALTTAFLSPSILANRFYLGYMKNCVRALFATR